MERKRTWPTRNLNSEDDRHGERFKGYDAFDIGPWRIRRRCSGRAVCGRKRSCCDLSSVAADTTTPASQGDKSGRSRALTFRDGERREGIGVRAGVREVAGAALSGAAGLAWMASCRRCSASRFWRTLREGMLLTEEGTVVIEVRGMPC